MAEDHGDLVSHNRRSEIDFKWDEKARVSLDYRRFPNGRVVPDPCFAPSIPKVTNAREFDDTLALLEEEDFSRPFAGLVPFLPMRTQH